MRGKLIEWNVMYAKIKARLVIVGMLVLQKRANRAGVFHAAGVWAEDGVGGDGGVADMGDAGGGAGVCGAGTGVDAGGG